MLGIVLFADFFDAGDIISLITRTIDLFAVLIIGVSAVQAMVPLITSVVIDSLKRNNDLPIKGFINSFLLALELESANAILKMAAFASGATSTTDNLTSDNINNFILFVAVLSVRIAINRTSRRFRIGKNRYAIVILLYCQTHLKACYHHSI